MAEQYKYEIIKKLVETNGNKNHAALKLNCTRRHINRMIHSYKTKGKVFLFIATAGDSPVIHYHLTSNKPSSTYIVQNTTTLTLLTFQSCYRNVKIYLFQQVLSVLCFLRKVFFRRRLRMPQRRELVFFLKKKEKGFLQKGAYEDHWKYPFTWRCSSKKTTLRFFWRNDTDGCFCSSLVWNTKDITAHCHWWCHWVYSRSLF